MILTLPGAAAAAALALAPAAAGAQPAQQQAREPQGAVSPVIRLFNQDRDGPARYATPDGAVRFIFDRTYGRVALVQFEGDDEVHALRPRMGPDGSEIYTTDDGSVRLLFTHQGGIIVYAGPHSTGAPASVEERVAPLSPAQVAFAAFQARLRQLQEQAARSVGRRVTFEAPVQVNRPVSGVVLDAAERAAEGLAEAPLTTVSRVVITIGPRPEASVQGESLNIQVAPELGYAGRPSSARIRAVVTGESQGPDR